MPLPTLTKQYQFLVNVAAGQTGTTAERMVDMLWNVKDRLKAFSSWPWVVDGSGTAAAAGMDSVDRWTGGTDIVFGSWLVLRQPATGLEVLLFYDHVDALLETSISVWMSPSAGFTGGGVGSRPTATDEIQVVNGNASEAWADDMQGRTARVHALHSTDGENTIVIVSYDNGDNGSVWLFGRPTRTVSGWSSPVIGMMRGLATPGVLLVQPRTKTNLSGNPRVYASLEHAATGSSTSDSVAEVLAGPDDLTSEYPVQEMGLSSIYDSPLGELGVYTDIWAVYGGLASGSRMPASGTKTFAAFDGFLIPWNNTTVQLG